MDRPQFLGGHVSGVHGALSKGTEAAVRVEVDLLGTTVLEQGLNLMNNRVHGLDKIRSNFASGS